MTLTWPQTIAAVFLLLEVGTGLSLGRTPIRNYYGWMRALDALVWSSLLWWGGFFTH